MTATAFIITTETGRNVGVYATRAKAESMADRIGGDVAERAVEVNSRVSFSFHGHPRSGRVVVAEGSHVEVEFHQNSTGKIVRRFSVNNINF